MPKVRCWVYLIHFDSPYRHARHYVGYTAAESLEDRIDRHRRGTGALLLRVVNRAGIGWQVARTWEFDNTRDARRKEIQLKKRAATRYCPRCSPTSRSERRNPRGTQG